MDILVRPPELRKKANDLRQLVNQIQRSIDAVDVEIKSLNTGVFEGVSADTFRIQYSRVHSQAISFVPFLVSFAKALDDTASAFESADKAS